MNYNVLKQSVTEQTDLSQAIVDQVIRSVVTIVHQQISSGGYVKIPGLGKFLVVERAPRKGVNPVTRKSINIPASKAPKFKPAKDLKTAAKGKAA